MADEPTAPKSESKVSFLGFFQGLWNDLSKSFPSRLRSQLALVVLLFVGAVAWLQAVSQPIGEEIRWVPAVLMLAGAAWIFSVVAFRLLRKRVADDVAEKASERVVETVSSEIRGALFDVHPESGILVGVRIGRRSVTCGALAITSTSGHLPQARDYKTLVPGRDTNFDPSAAPDVRLDAAAQMIAAIAAEARDARPELQIERVGVGIPGFVDPRRGAVESPQSMHVIEEIARRLSNGRARTHVFGATHQEDFENICLLDNDVRCATRSILSRHLDDRIRDRGWDNFAALHLGTGVGVGLVLGGKIHYGSHGWAGEIGHIDLAPAQGIAIGTEAGPLPKMKCTCGHVGYHFESLVNYHGLMELGKSVCPNVVEEADDIARRLADPWNFEREVWPTLVCSPGNSSPLPTVLRDFAQTEDARRALPILRGIHVALVAGAIASLANLFDIEKVVLFGSLYKLMSELEVDPDLHQIVTERLKTPMIRYDFAEVENDTWRGAALVARDADFADFLAGRSRDSLAN